MKQVEIPDEVIHIRQAWIKAINRVAEAIAYRFKRDVNDQYSERSGIETVVESVVALKCILVDYDEATIESDVMDWYKKHIDELGKGDMKRMMFYRLGEFYIWKAIDTILYEAELGCKWADWLKPEPPPNP